MSFKAEVFKDIQLCNEVLEAKDANRAQIVLNRLIGTYEDYIKSITSGLSTYEYFNESPDYLQDLETFKRKLELLRSSNKPQPTPVRSSSPKIEINNRNENLNNNQNTNTNTNQISIELLFERTRQELEANETLTEEERQEILEKVNEIEEIHQNDGNASQKWRKLRNSMGWLGTKGLAIAKLIIPLITAVISANK